MAERALSTRVSARPHLLTLDRTRARLEAAVERLIALLDDYDGSEEDMEEDDFGGGDICDEPHDDEGDAEPWLASPEPSTLFRKTGGNVYRIDGSQIPWARGGDDDREIDTDSGIGDHSGLVEQLGDAQ